MFISFVGYSLTGERSFVICFAPRGRKTQVKRRNWPLKPPSVSQQKISAADHPLSFVSFGISYGELMNVPQNGSHAFPTPGCPVRTALFFMKKPLSQRERLRQDLPPFFITSEFAIFLEIGQVGNEETFVPKGSRKRKKLLDI